jgi:hypothetical protein
MSKRKIEPLFKKRPLFNSAWIAFSQVHTDILGVGKIIGGKVQHNIEMGTAGGFENACPIRMSYVLNQTGFPISKSHHYAMVSGGDHRRYIYRVTDMIRYLTKHFGKPDKLKTAPLNSADFANMKGIVVFTGHGSDNASGHITLWDGNVCSDACHFYPSSDSHLIPESAMIWVLL